MTGFFDLLMRFLFQLFESEGDFLSFDEKLLEVHEIEENQHGHPYVVLAVLLQSFQNCFVLGFQIFFPKHFSFRS